MVPRGPALLALALAAVAALPYDDHSRDEVVYDQRQNGSENYRVHVDGVLVAVVPADVLLPLVANAAGDDLQHQLDELLKPTTPAPAAAPTTPHTEKPAADKPPKGRLRLSSFLMPLLRRL